MRGAPAMLTRRNIALDGPHNGFYITREQAMADGYELIDWNYDGEQAYLAPSTEMTSNGVPVEFYDFYDEEDYPRD